MESKLTLYNTLDRRKETFEPINPPHVGMYVCGPTVYGDPHLGHARPAVTFDLLFRYLRSLGYKVRYVRNVTDVGHLEHDADDGEDKISKKARLEQLEPMEVAHYYTERYHRAMDELNVLSPSIEPCASGHIIEQIAMVKEILDNGFAYESNGSVYFDVEKYNRKYSYGRLSGRNLDDILTNTRELDGQGDKRHSCDFALWKKASPEHIMRWPSPWSDGFPGWHAECTAMGKKYLGEHFDIHGGGMDLIFPHHECEIAQAVASQGEDMVHYWMHNGFLNINNQKMSKSANNFFTVREIADKYGYEPIRYFMLTAGYRMPLNYTVDLIESCKNSLERLYTCRENLDFALSKTDFGTDETLKEKAAEARTKFCTAMDDDLNTPDALAAVFDLVKEINTLSAASSKAALETAAAAFDEITGVLGLLYNRKKDEVPAEVTALVEKRAAAKKAKDWATADAIRAQLTELGWAVKDTAQGPQLSKL